MVPKRRLLPIHRWVGLIVSAFVLAQAGTGALLVYRTHLAELLDPRGMTSASGRHDAPISAVVGAARARFPGFEIEHVVFPQTERGVYVAHLLDGDGHSRWASVDAGTAEVLRAGRIWSFPLEAAMQIHYRLMTGRLGLACIMGAALGLLTLAVSGLWYWWPKAGRWRRSLAIEKGAPARLLLRRLHRNVGVFAAVVALFSATTGLIVAAEFFLAPGPLMPLQAAGASVGDLDAALARAREIYPNRGIRDVRAPGAGRLNVYFWAPETSPHAVHAVSLDLRDGRAVAVRPAQSSPGLWMAILPIHSGDSFGRFGSFVVFAGGVALMALAATGPIMWLQRRGGASNSRRPRPGETP
jgi:uncharacterized iron-regulated membrane protein